MTTPNDLAKRLEQLAAHVRSELDAVIAGLAESPEPVEIPAVPPVPDIWSWPTDFVTPVGHPSHPFTQRYGDNPKRYARFGLPGHEGVDIRTGVHGRIYCALAGRVKIVGWQNNSKESPYGWHLRTVCRLPRPNNPTAYDDYEVIYAHLTENSTRHYGAYVQPLIKPGDLVEAGQHIAYSGMTGNTEAEHLHLTVKRNGLIVDPAPFLLPVAAKNS